MKNKQSSLASNLLFLFTILFLFSLNIGAQTTSDKAPEKATPQPLQPTPPPRPAGCIQKGGSKFITDNNGNFSFKIPDSFLKKLKDYPNKYKVKFKLLKVPNEFLKAKLNNASPGAETKFLFELKAGFDKKLNEIGKIISKIKHIDEFNLTRAEITGSMIVGLGAINPLGGGNGGGNCMLAGEPIPGGEIYVELEPDDEP